MVQIIISMKLYLLYIGDAWLSNSSLQLLAPCTTVEKAVELGRIYSKKNHLHIDESDWHELEVNHQTYGYSDNFMIQPIMVDELDV